MLTRLTNADQTDQGVHCPVSSPTMCVLSSCCCGWQNLHHGLFIFSVADLFIRFLMVGLNIITGASGVAGFNGFLMLADIGLALGVKLHVGLLVFIM